MSVAGGFPDWQRITQWFGSPLATETGKVINAAPYTVGPFDVRNFASIVVCVKPTVQNLTVTITQQVPAGPATLLVTSSFPVAAGNVKFESFVLLAGAVSVTFTGAGAGTSIDYAIVPSNANTNAEVSTLAQLAFQHNGVAVANETGLDVEDSATITWTLTDDPANTRVQLSGTVVSPIGLDGWAALAGAFTYDSVDGPTGVVNTPSDFRSQINFGHRFSYVESGTTKYGIVTAITATKLTFYSGTGTALTNVAITVPRWSPYRFPVGFNGAADLWTETLRDANNRVNATPGNGWVNPPVPVFSLPIGAWLLGWKGAGWVYTDSIHNRAAFLQVTLSTANNTESDPDLTAAYLKPEDGTTGAYEVTVPMSVPLKPVTVAAKTSYYMNVRSASADGGGNLQNGVRGADPNYYAETVIRAVCAYL